MEGDVFYLEGKYFHANLQTNFENSFRASFVFCLLFKLCAKQAFTEMGNRCYSEINYASNTSFLLINVSSPTPSSHLCLTFLKTDFNFAKGAFPIQHNSKLAFLLQIFRMEGFGKTMKNPIFILWQSGTHKDETRRVTPLKVTLTVSFFFIRLSLSQARGPALSNQRGSRFPRSPGISKESFHEGIFLSGTMLSPPQLHKVFWCLSKRVRDKVMQNRPRPVFFCFHKGFCTFQVAVHTILYLLQAFISFFLRLVSAVVEKISSFSLFPDWSGQQPGEADDRSPFCKTAKS